MISSTENKTFHTILLLMVFSLGTSTSGSAIFSTLLGLYSIYFLSRYKLWKDVFKYPGQIWMMAFLVIGYISLMLNPDLITDPNKSFRKFRYIIFGLISVPVFEYYFKNKLLNFKKIFYTLLFSYLLATIIGNISRAIDYEVLRFQPRDHNGRMPGITGIMQYGYETPWAALIGLSFFFTKDFFKGVNWKLLLGIGVVLCVGILTSNTRGGILGLAAGIPFLFYVNNRKLFKRGIIAGVIFVVIFVGISLSGIAGKKSQVFQGLKGSSNMERAELQLQSWNIFKRKPWLGHGFYSYKAVDPKETMFHKKDKKYAVMDTHNTWFQVLTDMGLLGFIPFCIFIFYWFKNIMNTPPQMLTLLLPCFITFMVTSLVHTMLLTGTGTAAFLMLLYNFSFYRENN